ncbi:MAG: hypothetical protein L0G22_08255 [Propionibacteriaceae bacterium]|nr:hypothetical protein [Propionibacteriaceae bacterium]
MTIVVIPTLARAEASVPRPAPQPADAVETNVRGASIETLVRKVEQEQGTVHQAPPNSKAMSRAGAPGGRSLGGGSVAEAREGWTRESWQYFIDRIPECEGALRASSECQLAAPPPVDPADPAAPVASQPVAPPAAVVRSLAREAVLTMELPSPEVRVGPDPSVNEWDMAVVGYPLWLWTETAASVEASTTQYGITIVMSAVRDRVVFDMGDGNTMTCRGMSRLPGGTKAGTPSPDCGYAYSWPSLPEGDYTVTATSQWSVTWSALGYSGTVPVEVSATRELPVGELQAVIVG